MLETPVLISTWHARDGSGPELERRAGEAVAAAGRLQGHLGGTVLREPGSPDVHIVHRFDTPAALEQWSGDRRHAALIDRLEEVGERRGTPERLTGLEAWFREQAPPPPRWKMWLASFVGAWIAANAPPVLELGGAVDGGLLRRFVARVSG